MLGVGLVDDVVDDFVGLIYVLVWGDSVEFDNLLSENGGCVGVNCATEV